MTSIKIPMHGVAVDAGSGLASAILAARASQARDDDLLVFKRCVVQALSGLATTLLVDAALGRSLLADFEGECHPMLAFEADVYRINGKDRITVFPDDLKVSDYQGLGSPHLKLFMYYAPRGEASVNQKKQELVARIGAECRSHDIAFLFEPLVYDDGVESGTLEFARLKPDLVRQATATFADRRFAINVLKVEMPVDFNFVEGFGEPEISRAEALDAFRIAASASGSVPMVYLSGGISFEWFRDALKMAQQAGIPFDGFMCGRAIWSDGIEIFGAGGETALAAWLKTTGRARFQALVKAATEMKDIPK